MRHRSHKAAAVLSLLAGAAASQHAAAQTVFYFENFDSAVLNQVSGDPRVTSACTGNAPSFTHVPPAGWSWTGCGMPTFECRTGATCPPSGATCQFCGNNEGVFEWEGWSFADKAFWVRVAGDQRRSEFTLGQGNVAIADPDEWDDRGNPKFNCGRFNAFMTTPAINLAGTDAASLVLNFASSWRPEAFDDPSREDVAQGRPPTNNQTATVRAIYTVGGVDQPAVTVLLWDSDPSSPNYKDDNSTNDNIFVDASSLSVPVGATAVKFEFSLTNAGNDWWWAIDNVILSADVAGLPTVLFLEDFEGVTLLPPVHEVPSGCGITYCDQQVFTHDGPNGVVVSLDPTVTGGVPDWRGWSFVRRPFWLCMSGGPNGANFVNGTGVIAVADGDEFDDLANTGPLDTTLATPAIDLSGRTAGVLVVSFDSSWRREAPQFATVVAEFDNGVTTELIRWESEADSPFRKDDAENELVARPLIVPSGANAVTLKFRYVGFNNWWWAIDNIRLFEGEAVVEIARATPNDAPMAVAPSIDYDPCFRPWSPLPPAGWDTLFDPIGGCPIECGRAEWRGWAFANKDWWWQQVDNQRREEFTNARGYIAIADPDEWDDAPNGLSQFNAFMTSPSIALAGPLANATLAFDSSWRPEGFDDGCSCGETNNQTATITAVYTVGGVPQPPVEVLRWDSDESGPFFKPDSTNEHVVLNLSIPNGATAVRFEYGLTKARNDWWWAVDNIAFTVNGSTLFSEDFEQPLALQAPPTENPAVQQCKYFSTVAAQGLNFTVDNAGLIDCPGGEFTGFNAWLTDAWARSEGGQRSGHGAPFAFISDFNAGQCDGLARLITPAYSIIGVNPNTVTLDFRSGWLNEAGHVSSVEVSFDGGAWQNVLAWNAITKPTVVDEIVSVEINNPEGASTVRFRFNDQDAGWWAVSQIVVTGVVGTPPCPVDFNGDGFVDFFDFDTFVDCFEGGACPDGRDGDFNGDGFVDFFDFDAFVFAFENGC
ncbi:MAG: hypothetical protein HRU70_13885 [Phycisphaeraceae bacterium]|nr:MAG: hypothetical protein HRU70_13885 [Phycisphaeraceae bacterium]